MNTEITKTLQQAKGIEAALADLARLKVEYPKSPALSTWVVELNDDGTIIYSRPNPFIAGQSDTSLEGHNFFEEGVVFEDIAKCRKHFDSFVKSRKASESFIWRSSSMAGGIDRKVMLTRAFQTGYCTPTGVIMMEIRGN